MLLTNLLYELPLGKGKQFLPDVNSVLNHVVGGWQLYWIAYLETGQFFSPSFSGADPSGTNTIGGLPDRIKNGNLASDQRSISHWFDGTAFVAPPSWYEMDAVVTPCHEPNARATAA